MVEQDKKHERWLSAEKMLNAIIVLAILIFTLVMLALQLIINELPCPLCLLQRFSFLAIAFGFLLNLRFGLRASHYGVILFSSLFNAFVALRQIAISFYQTGEFQSSLFGLRLSIWSFGISILLIIFTCSILSLERKDEKILSSRSYWKSITASLFAMLMFLIFIYAVTAFVQCGFSPCTEHPLPHKLVS
jgi:disulfide bond formation protein DsbB